MTSPAVDLPEIVAEVTAIFEEYEAALARHDTAHLDASFWASPQTVRYGVAEELYGNAAIQAWRQAMTPVPPTRTHGPTVVATFGRDAATVSTEFDNGDGSPPGRQMQTWIRFSEGWRIVAAHVSLRAAT